MPGPVGGPCLVKDTYILSEGFEELGICLLYTSDAADERSSVDLGGRRIIKKKKHKYQDVHRVQRHNTNTIPTVHISEEEC